jgi:hypothetical protein
MSEHEFVRAAQEALDYLGLAERPAESRQDGGVDPDGEALAVDEHPFGVEDHKPGPTPQLRAAGVPRGLIRRSRRALRAA